MRGESEAQVERGTVLEILPGPPARARVLLSAGPGCEECGARAFCSPEDVERRSLLAHVSGSTPRPGDQVRVAVSGSRVLAAGMWAYGFPLLGLCCGLGLGWAVFAGHAGGELLASLLGLLGAAVPFAALWLRSRSRPTEEWFEARIVPGDDLAISSRGSRTSAGAPRRGGSSAGPAPSRWARPAASARTRP